jgi:hypothetical protein
VAVIEVFLTTVKSFIVAASGGEVEEEKVVTSWEKPSRKGGGVRKGKPVI